MFGEAIVVLFASFTGALLAVILMSLYMGMSKKTDGKGDELLDEVSYLLRDLRIGWEKIGPMVYAKIRAKSKD